MKKTLFAALVAALLCSCGSSETKLTKGSLSKMDTLSYAMGVNIATSFDYQMGDIPFDVTAIEKGIQEGALDKASMTHEEAIEQLRDYFSTKRPVRAQQIAADRAQQDSIRLAQGDSMPLPKRSICPTPISNVPSKKVSVNSAMSSLKKSSMKATPPAVSPLSLTA